MASKQMAALARGLCVSQRSAVYDRPSPQSCGSTFTIAAPWLLPIHSTGRPLVSSTNTRRILVVRGMRYSVTSSVLVLIRETRSFDIDPVHTSVPPLVG